MTIVGLDPSYSRTGMSIFHSKDDYEVHSITFNQNEENILIAMDNAFKISKEVRRKILDLGEDINNIVFAVEYPILATRAGSYLGMITCKLDSMFRSLKAPCVVYIPSVAIKAYTHTSTKTELVNWFKNSGIVSKCGSINHDEVSALILGEIARKALSGEYKKSAYQVNYSK